MSETLIDKVLEAKAEAEASTGLSNGVPLDPRQEAAVLIAQVQAIMGTYEPKAKPEAEAEPEAETATETPTEDSTS